MSLCNALALAALPVTLWRGAVDDAEGYLALLHDNVRRHDISIWRPVGRCFGAAVSKGRGEPGAVDTLRAAVAERLHGGFGLRSPLYLSMLAEALAGEGALGEVQVTATAARGRAAAQNERWSLPEVLRVAGVIRMRRCERDAADRLFTHAIAEAEAIGARSWQLRAAIGLCENGRHTRALPRLDAVYKQFGEGFATQDLLRAAEILAAARRTTRKNRRRG